MIPVNNTFIPIQTPLHPQDRIVDICRGYPADERLLILSPFEQIQSLGQLSDSLLNLCLQIVEENEPSRSQYFLDLCLFLLERGESPKSIDDLGAQVRASLQNTIFKIPEEEKARHSTVALWLSDLLLTKSGYFKNGICSQLINLIQGLAPLSANDQQQITTLHTILNDQKAHKILYHICRWHKDSEQIIRTVLNLPAGEQIMAHHVRKAVLSALLTPYRQIEQGNCFAVSFASYVQQKFPRQTLEDLRDILEKKHLKREGELFSYHYDPTLSVYQKPELLLDLWSSTLAAMSAQLIKGQTFHTQVTVPLQNATACLVNHNLTLTHPRANRLFCKWTEFRYHLDGADGEGCFYLYSKQENPPQKIDSKDLFVKFLKTVFKAAATTPDASLENQKLVLDILFPILEKEEFKQDAWTDRGGYSKNILDVWQFKSKILKQTLGPTKLSASLETLLSHIGKQPKSSPSPMFGIYSHECSISPDYRKLKSPIQARMKNMHETVAAIRKKALSANDLKDFEKHVADLALSQNIQDVFALSFKTLEPGTALFKVGRKVATCLQKAFCPNFMTNINEQFNLGEHCANVETALFKTLPSGTQKTLSEQAITIADTNWYQENSRIYYSALPSLILDEWNIWEQNESKELLYCENSQLFELGPLTLTTFRPAKTRKVTESPL